MVFPFEFPALERWEGSRSRLATMSRGLVERGVEVHVLSKADPNYSGATLEGVGLERFPPLGERRGGKALGALLAGRRVQELCEDGRFDLVHCHMPVMASSVALWKRGIRAPTIFDTHDWFKVRDEAFHNAPFLPRGAAGPLDWLEREVARAHDRVIVTTPLLHGLLRLPGREAVVPNPIDTSHFAPGESRARETLLSGAKFVVGFLGFVSLHQGFWDLLEATRLLSAKVEGVRLLAVGGGLIDEAREQARRLGIADRVVFTGPGRVPYSQVPDLVNAMDVGVSPLQPAPRYQEYAQPLKVLEYMSCGVPTVVTPLREQARLAAEGGGAVAGGFGGEQIAEAILSLVEGGRAARREASRRYAVENHSVASVLERLLECYRGLLG